MALGAEFYAAPRRPCLFEMGSIKLVEIYILGHANYLGGGWPDNINEISKTYQDYGGMIRSVKSTSATQKLSSLDREKRYNDLIASSACY